MTPYDEPTSQPERPRDIEPPAKDRRDHDDATRGGTGRESREVDPDTGRRRTPKPHQDGVPTD
jgi:hypothetical protein